jgi:hypothetical protein
MKPNKEPNPEVTEVLKIAKQHVEALSKLSTIKKDNYYITLAGNIITFYARECDAARGLVGALTRELKSRPTVSKPWKEALGLDADFKYKDIVVRVANYRPRTCEVKKRIVVVPAQPAQEAMPEYTKVVEELVCEL